MISTFSEYIVKQRKRIPLAPLHRADAQWPDKSGTSLGEDFSRTDQPMIQMAGVEKQFGFEAAASEEKPAPMMMQTNNIVQQLSEDAKRQTYAAPKREGETKEEQEPERGYTADNWVVDMRTRRVDDNPRANFQSELRSAAAKGVSWANASSEGRNKIKMSKVEGICNNVLNEYLGRLPGSPAMNKFQEQWDDAWELAEKAYAQSKDRFTRESKVHDRVEKIRAGIRSAYVQFCSAKEFQMLSEAVAVKLYGFDKAMDMFMFEYLT